MEDAKQEPVVSAQPDANMDDFTLETSVGIQSGTQNQLGMIVSFCLLHETCWSYLVCIS